MEEEIPKALKGPGRRQESQMAALGGRGEAGGWLLRRRGKKYTAWAPSLLEIPRGDGKEEVVGKGAGGLQGDCV